MEKNSEVGRKPNKKIKRRFKMWKAIQGGDSEFKRSRMKDEEGQEGS